MWSWDKFLFGLYKICGIWIGCGGDNVRIGIGGWGMGVEIVVMVWKWIRVWGGY